MGRLCGCGCGEETPIATHTLRRHNWIKGQPKPFVNCWHARRIPRVPRVTEPVLCECGCGQPAPLAKQAIKALGLKLGEPRRYVAGHHPRARGAQHASWKGGRYKDQFGYVMIHRPQDPRADTRGYVREHIALVEAVMGKELRRTAHVHHVDGDRTNNVSGNLVACDSSAYHQLLHMRQRALAATGDPNKLICYLCGGYDDRSNLRQHGTHRSHEGCRRAWALGRRMEVNARRRARRAAEREARNAH